MFSRSMENIIFVVIILFSVLTFVSLSLGDSSDEYTSPIEIAELILLVIFLFEMLIKLYAVGLVRCYTALFEELVERLRYRSRDFKPDFGLGHTSERIARTGTVEIQCCFTAAQTYGGFSEVW